MRRWEHVAFVLFPGMTSDRPPANTCREHMSGDKRGKKPIACSHYLGLGRLSGQVSRREPLELTVA